MILRRSPTGPQDALAFSPRIRWVSRSPARNRRDPHIDFHFGLIGNDIGPGAPADDSYVDRCFFRRIVQVIQLDNLMSQLLNGADPFRIINTRMSSYPANGDFEMSHALSKRLQGPSWQAGFQDQNCLAP